MNTTPKQQDDGGIAAADGSRPALDQTVLGVAPPPPSGVSPSGAAPHPAPSEAKPIDGASALIAAPTIAVADARAPDLPSPTDALIPPAVHVSPALGVGDTLPLARPSAPALGQSEPGPGPSIDTTGETNGALALDRTALSDDYLRAAREAALGQLTVAPSRPSSGQAADSSASTATAEPVPSTDTVSKEPGVEATMGFATRASIGTASSGAPTGADRSGGALSARCFAESISGALSPLAEVGSHRNLPPPRPRPPAPRRETAGRWLLLASVALATVAVVTFGSRVVNHYRSSAATGRSAAAGEEPSPDRSAPPLAAPIGASRATLANRPAGERGASDGRPRVVSATGAPGTRAVGEEGPASSASPESQLAAAAGRHVLTGNFAEALPLYRQLERNWPENTAYAAMARLLEKRLGSTNDTRTISPTTPGP
jgi:hypothetical protein